MIVEDPIASEFEIEKEESTAVVVTKVTKPVPAPEKVEPVPAEEPEAQKEETIALPDNRMMKRMLLEKLRRKKKGKQRNVPAMII